jgi:hypothetical protein
MPNTRRVVSILCLVAFLAVPLLAQPAQSGREPAIPFLSFLSAMWERLTEPVHGASATVSIREADGVTPEPTPTPGSTGRGGWDPNG